MPLKLLALLKCLNAWLLLYMLFFFNVHFFFFSEIGSHDVALAVLELAV